MKSKTAYYLILLIGAIELGRGIQIVFTQSFWNLLSANARLVVLLQFTIGGVLFYIARMIKPKRDEE